MTAIRRHADLSDRHRPDASKANAERARCRLSASHSSCVLQSGSATRNLKTRLGRENLSGDRRTSDPRVKASARARTTSDSRRTSPTRARIFPTHACKRLNRREKPQRTCARLLLHRATSPPTGARFLPRLKDRNSRVQITCSRARDSHSRVKISHARAQD